MLTLIIVGLVAAGAGALTVAAARDFHREGIARLERAGYRKHAARVELPSNVRVITPREVSAPLVEVGDDGIARLNGAILVEAPAQRTGADA